MGAMNKHPSCQHTWRQTTLASKKISEAFAGVLNANAALEDALLAEFSGARDQNAMGKMMSELTGSAQNLLAAQGLIHLSIETSCQHPDEFASARKQLDATELSAKWNGTLLAGSAEMTHRLILQIKNDRLATAKQFVSEIDSLLALYPPVVKAFQTAWEYADVGGLREALATNKVPVQRTFSVLFSTWSVFMNEYLIDSLVGTHIAFVTRHNPLLVEA